MEIRGEQRNIHLRVSRTENEQYQDGILFSGLPESKGEDLLDLVCTVSKVLNVNLAAKEIKSAHRLHSLTQNAHRLQSLTSQMKGFGI